MNKNFIKETDKFSEKKRIKLFVKYRKFIIYIVERTKYGHPVINYSKKSTEGAVIYSYVSYENKKHVVYIHTSLFKTCSVLNKHTYCTALHFLGRF